MYVNVIVHSTAAQAGATTPGLERYAAEVRKGRVERAHGPLDRLQGLGARAVRDLLDDGSRSSTSLTTKAEWLRSLVATGRAEIVEVPDVTRVQVGVMGDSIEDDVDARDLALAWIGRIQTAYGVDEVCVACTVNLRGFPAKDHATAYWTADGERHGRVGDGSGTDLSPITRWCWEAAMADARGEPRGV